MTHTLINEIQDLIESDDSNKVANSNRAIARYNKLISSQKEAVDLIFTTICGYSLATIIASMED